MAEIETLTAREREELEWPMPHRTQPKALRIIDAQAARITELDVALREIQKINRDGFKAPEVMAQLIDELTERALAGKGL